MDLDTIIKEYERTEITALWIHDRFRDEHFNIFSVAEICPFEQAPTDSIQIDRINLDKNRTLYITREFKDTPQEGVNYFRGQREVQGISLESYSQLTMEPPAEIPMLTGKTKFPHTALEQILPKRPVSFRVCTYLEEQQVTLQQLNDKDLLKIGDFTKQYLGFDLSVFKEFIGAILLAMPNPYLRDLNITGIPEQNAVLVQFYERFGKTIVDGKIEIYDQRLFGTGFRIQEKITRRKMLIKLPHMPEKFKIKIFDMDDDLIYEKESAFMQSLALNMQVAGTVRKVEDVTARENYEVQTYTAVNSIVGKEKSDLQDKLLKEEEERMLAQLEKNKTFVYFPGKSKDSVKYAKEIIRELIGSTKERCIICDPYFSGEDLLNYALFQRNTNVTFQCLSSAKFLKEIKNAEMKEGKYLQERINYLQEADPSLKVACKVLKGANKSPVHDRFLVIDTEVYLLGSSLNEFGSRATTLLKVPNPKVIIRQIEIWWEDSTFTLSLDDWLKKGNAHE